MLFFFIYNICWFYKYNKNIMPDFGFQQKSNEVIFLQHNWQNIGVS